MPSTHEQAKTQIEEAIAALPLCTGLRKGDEWYTDLELIADVRQCLGSIDLDPATCAAAQAGIQAKVAYCVEDDGLSQPWQGNTWLNPPYSQPLVSLFTERLIREYQSGAVPAACCIVNNATDTGWFHKMAIACTRMLLFKGRKQFAHSDPDRRNESNRQGQVLFYFGPNPHRFRQIFGKYGFIPGDRSEGEQCNCSQPAEFRGSWVNLPVTHELPETGIDQAIAALHHKKAELENQGIRGGWVEESSVVKPNGKTYKQFHYCASAASRKYLKKTEVAQARAEIERSRRVYSINREIEILEQVRRSVGSL